MHVVGCSLCAVGSNVGSVRPVGSESAERGGILLFVGLCVYLYYTPLLCFDYCGAAERYVRNVFQLALITLGPGALLTAAAGVLWLRALRRASAARTSRLTLGGVVVAVFVATLFI
jgi:hypothetical protein